ncbi:hypothetical protein [Ornithinibacillus xuwenensis]|uniref:Uncharacterized protein n=1 Tax=Ornithinibacillus xuwenensis TaxID=3144668 RepID=A0ABU9XH67_9BACI
MVRAQSESYNVDESESLFYQEIQALLFIVLKRNHFCELHASIVT